MSDEGTRKDKLGDTHTGAPVQASLMQPELGRVNWWEGGLPGGGNT